MLKIKVTQKEIDRGTKTCGRCPIGLSILNNLNKVDFVFVNLYVVHFTFINKAGKYETCRYKLSKRLKRFIRDFDSGKPVKPTTFYLWDCIHKIKPWKNTLGFY